VISVFLKDIDLDLPFNENMSFIEELKNKQGMDEKDAIRLDYEKNWKEKRLTFRDEIRCIANSYLQHLGKFQTNETKKLMINCVERISLEEVNSTSDGFTDVEVEFDFSAYEKLNNEEKKKLILEKLYEGVLKASEVFEWDMPILNRTYQSVIESNYKNEYIWKQKTSPSKKYTAEIFCQHEIDKYVVTMIIKKKHTNELVKNEILFTERPHELAFVQYLGNLKWISDTEVILLSKYNKNKKWLVCIE
jgi:hypothetical protein